MRHSVRIELMTTAQVSIKENEFIIEEQIAPRNEFINAYIVYDNVRCYIGQISDIEQLYEYIGPENLLNTIDELASEYEYDSLMDALNESGFMYTFNGNTYVAKNKIIGGC